MPPTRSQATATPDAAPPGPEGEPVVNVVLPPPVPVPPPAAVAAVPVPKPTSVSGTYERNLVDIPYCYRVEKSAWTDFKRAINNAGYTWNLAAHCCLSRKTISRNLRKET